MSRASKNGDSLDPDEFMIHISKLVEEEIEECVDNIKKGLLKKKDPEMTEESLREPCKKLRRSMREEFSKNLNKFELYAKRNIFTESTGGDDSYNGELEQKIQEVKDEAAKLTDLRQKYADMANECREAEQMLADMKSSLFGLRVGAQVFEQLTVQPLQDAVSNIVEHKTALLELAAKADSLAQQIAITYEGASGNALTITSSSRSPGIKTSSAKDVQNLIGKM